ncbi:MAG TPA: SDR family NAD(P)-dependent oxidoreductase [Solirubrobacteraceae bacterium]
MRALVTGGARGIGAAIVARLRADGLDVVVLDRDQPADFEFDVASDGELPDLGDVDVCVSNAGITTTIAPAHRMTREQWQRDIDVNLTGAFRVIQACLPGMRERGFGRIVVISSGAARSGLPGQVAYAASKAGLLGLTRTVAAENAHKGITANAILPGLVATEAVLAMPEEIRERASAGMPIGRLVEPEEIAATTAFLASEAAGAITGEALSVDGGIHLNTHSLTRRG